MSEDEMVVGPERASAIASLIFFCSGLLVTAVYILAVIWYRNNEAGFLVVMAIWFLFCGFCILFQTDR